MCSYMIIEIQSSSSSTLSPSPDEVEPFSGSSSFSQRDWLKAWGADLPDIDPQKLITRDQESSFTDNQIPGRQ